MKKHRGNRNERGAALVEFAIVAPLLILLLFGIIEFGWIFGQFNAVRHGAREAARFAAVDGGDNNAIMAVLCNAVEGQGAGITSIEASLDDGGTVGASATITVRFTVAGLTGVFGAFLPPSMQTEAVFRLEQDSTQWGAQGFTSVPSC